MSDQGLLADGVSVLSKPFSRTGLLDAVHALLAGAAVGPSRMG